MKDDMSTVAQGLADILGRGKIHAWRPGIMTDQEQGWSGAQVCRVEVTYENGQSENMVLKEAAHKERMVMKTLTNQGHTHTPAAFSLDLEGDAPQWMALEDVGHVKCPPPDIDWMPSIAHALAGIHFTNMGKGANMPWLPHADHRYWKEYLITQISVDHFEALMEENADFSKEFGHYLPRLREKASTFAEDMAALYDEKDCLTLTHGDLQTVDGAHIHYVQRKPYIIDFGWCHYAPFYIDLVSYFSFEESKLYYDALQRRGMSLKYGDFIERLQAAFCYSGLIYLCPSVRQWAAGPTQRTGKRLLQMLRIILSGEFPERRIHYSDGLFLKLAQAHREGTLATSKL